jgi:DNA-directed RNA polymerase subunit RPC12/RpoP
VLTLSRISCTELVSIREIGERIRLQIERIADAITLGNVNSINREFSIMKPDLDIIVDFINPVAVQYPLMIETFLMIEDLNVDEDRDNGVMRDIDRAFDNHNNRKRVDYIQRLVGEDRLITLANYKYFCPRCGVENELSFGTGNHRCVSCGVKTTINREMRRQREGIEVIEVGV